MHHRPDWSVWGETTEQRESIRENSQSREPRLKLYFDQHHWMYSLQNTLFVNVTSASSLSASATTANKTSCCLTTMSQPPSAPGGLGNATPNESETLREDAGGGKNDKRPFVFVFFFHKCALGSPWWSDQDTLTSTSPSAAHTRRIGHLSHS